MQKKKVHYDILEDMKKYVDGFKESEYQKTCNDTDYSVISYLKSYYAGHLPVDVTAWMRVNEPSESLIYGKGMTRQIVFVRDHLNYLLFKDYEEAEKHPPMVISTHRSKSVVLPVLKLENKKYGLEIVLRDNFYDWKVSVKCRKPLDFDFMGLTDPAKNWPYYYCEGFPLDKIYGSYKENHMQFTCEIATDYNLYTFIYLLQNYLGIKKPKKRSSKEKTE